MDYAAVQRHLYVSSMLVAKEKTAVQFERWKYKHPFKSISLNQRLLLFRVRTLVMDVRCRKDVLNMENIHFNPHKWLKAMLPSKSAEHCTVEIK